MRHLLLCLALAACDGSDDAASDAPELALDATSATDSAPADTPALDDADGSPPDLDLAELADTAEAIDALIDSEPDSAGDELEPPAAPAFYLTIDRIPPEMNGSRPAITPDGELPFRLRVNRHHVTLDVLALPESGPFTVHDLAIGCDADAAPHALPSAIEVAPGHLRLSIDAEHAFPHTPDILCTASISTAGGTATSTLAFGAVALTPELDPFPATDTWLVLLDRDTWALDVAELPDGTTDLRSRFTAQGDGIDDFNAPFFDIGLMPASDPVATAAIRAHLIRRVRVIVNGIYGLDGEGRPSGDGVNLRLYFEGDEGAPDPADFGGEGQRFSKIALTGDGAPDDQVGGTFGRARVDWNNQEVEDDTVYGLGVWPAAIVRTILKNPIGALLLADMRPALGGTPYGLAEGDALFIGQDVDPGTLPPAFRDRASRYNLLIQFGSLAIASILAHEIGHSLGLVPYGPPPFGLFAGVETDWVVSLAPDAHIDTVGLNVMQTGGSVNWVEAAAGELPRFEPLSWSYLRRQLVVGP